MSRGLGKTPAGWSFNAGPSPLLDWAAWGDRDLSHERFWAPVSSRCRLDRRDRGPCSRRRHLRYRRQLQRRGRSTSWLHGRPDPRASLRGGSPRYLADGRARLHCGLPAYPGLGSPAWATRRGDAHPGYRSASRAADGGGSPHPGQRRTGTCIGSHASIQAARRIAAGWRECGQMRDGNSYSGELPGLTRLGFFFHHFSEMPSPCWFARLIWLR